MSLERAANRKLSAVRGPEIAEDREPDTDRILTVPNVISLVRLAGIPVFLWFVSNDSVATAAVLLAVIAGTDWIDGGLARRWHQVTTLGKVLDPTIDRALLVAAFGAALYLHAMPIWLVAILLGRELLVVIGGLVLGLKGVRLAVTWWGKVYSSAMMVALPLFILGAADFTGAMIATVLAWIFVIPSGVLSWITAFQYWKNAKSQLQHNA